MRKAFQDVGWLFETDDKSLPVLGFSLGYDFCAEHEWGAKAIKQFLGIPEMAVPIGVEDRTMTRVPEELVFLEYQDRPVDKRYKARTPAALLYCANAWASDFEAKSVADKAHYFDVSFSWSPKDKYYDPEKHDIVCAWTGNSGFSINVRGEANVARLKELYEAMLRKEVSYAAGSQLGFMRKASALVMVPRLSEETKQSVREKDLAYKRLQDAAEATGIHKVLEDAGRKYYALSPDWMDAEAGELMFFLNPREQDKYAFGWFTVDELLAWAQGTGPVVDSREIENRLKKDVPDWGIYLLEGLNAIGVKQRIHEKFVWLDDKKTQVGVRIQVSASSTNKDFKSGTYPLEQIQQYVTAGQKLRNAVPA